MRRTQACSAYTRLEMLRRTNYIAINRQRAKPGAKYRFMEFLMFWRIFTRKTYHWRPAVDMRDGRIAAALMTFSSN